MRDILTGLAIILIVVLTTILVAPYFVDWNGQRDFLEARLSHALGQKVTVGGRIDLKLLPTPYLVLDQVVVGADDGPLKIGVHHLDLELSIAPLLHGEFDIVEARLEEPTVRLTLGRDRALPALPAAPAFAADVRFDRIRVADGTIAVADPESGHTFVLDHVDLDADAASFGGPFKMSGTAGAHGHRTKFRLITAAPQKDKAHARLVVEETADHAGVEIDGALGFHGGDGDTIRESFDGALVLSGHTAVTQDASTPWKLSGHFTADPGTASLDDGELRIGGDDAGVTLKAQAIGTLGDSARLALNLSAKQLDLDRLSGSPDDSSRPPPPRLPDLATLRRLLAAARPPIEIRIDLTIDDATYAGETLSDLAARLTLGGAATTPLRLAVDGPGGSHVGVDGTLAAGGTPRFQGSLAFSADNLPRAVAWLASVAPSLPLPDRDALVRRVTIDGRIDATAAAVASDRLALTLDRSTLAGPVRLALGAGSKAPKLTADLATDTLDLDDVPSLGALRDAATSLDLDLRLAAKSLKVARLGEGSLDAGGVALAIAKTGRQIELKSFRAADLGAAGIAASGRLGPASATLAVTLDATKLDAAAALVRQLAPGAPADALADRAGVLAPAKLTIDAAFAPAEGGRLALTRLAVAGTLGATKVAIASKPEADRPGAIAISAALTSPDGGALLRQLGLDTLPIAMLGAGRIDLSAHGRAGDPLDTRLAASFGATRLDASGAFDVLAASPRGSGQLRLRSPDATPLLQALAVAFPDMTARLPVGLDSSITLDADGARFADMRGRVAGSSASADLRWQRSKAPAPSLTGTLRVDRLALADLLALALGPSPAGAADGWSRAPFAVGLVDPPRTALALEAKALEIAPGLEATNARLDLGIAQNAVTLGKAAADLAGGRVAGAFSLRRDGHQATIEGHLGLDGVAVRLPALDARLTARLDLAGGGTSPQSLVASLAGSGSATADNLAVQGGDAGALPKVFADVEADNLAVDQETIARALADAAGAPLALGTRPFALSLAAGVLHFTPKDQESENQAPTSPVSSRLGVDLDLAHWRLQADLGQTLHALPKNWSGPPPTITEKLAGAPDGPPARSFDVSGFLDAVAARALARETARIEAYEFDIRERAFFNERLQSERRREADRQKAEDDARKAEADRKARAEAARQARLRAEQAARDQAAKDKADKAARDEAARDEAARENAARDRAAQDAAGRSAPPDRGQASPPSDRGPPPPQPPGRVIDPSMLGRY